MPIHKAIRLVANFVHPTHLSCPIQGPISIRGVVSKVVYKIPSIRCLQPRQDRAQGQGSASNEPRLQGQAMGPAQPA
ncbi:unnamed protein product [Prunus armeniaca]